MIDRNICFLVHRDKLSCLLSVKYVVQLCRIILGETLSGRCFSFPFSSNYPLCIALNVPAMDREAVTEPSVSRGGSEHPCWDQTSAVSGTIQGKCLLYIYIPTQGINHQRLHMVFQGETRPEFDVQKAA